ncbi:MAG TPA: polysaccharide deacetylase [Acidobacteriota bacterium]
MRIHSCTRALGLALLAGLVAAEAAAQEPTETKRRWPQGKVMALTLGFDVDGETLWWEDSEAGARPGPESYGRYGPREALPKILSLLKRHRAQATFFVPVWVAEKYPEPIRAIVEAGHELGAHGVRHESPADLSPEQEAAILQQSRTALEKVRGSEISGYRAPAWALSRSTLELVGQAGFLYSSNLMDADFPYVHQQPAGLVELPVSWVLDDAAHFWFDESSWEKPIVSAAAVLAIWKEEFEAIYDQGGYFNLTLHPQFIGRPARLTMLDQFLSWVETFPGVWVATGEQVARHVAESNR